MNSSILAFDIGVTTGVAFAGLNHVSLPTIYKTWDVKWTKDVKRLPKISEGLVCIMPQIILVELPQITNRSDRRMQHVIKWWDTQIERYWPKIDVTYVTPATWKQAPARAKDFLVYEGRVLSTSKHRRDAMQMVAWYNFFKFSKSAS